MLSVCIFFSDDTSKKFRVGAGAVHGLTHIVAALMTAWFVFLITGTPTPVQVNNPMGNAVSLALVFIFGAIVGSFLFGAYLFICQRVFGKEGDTAFAGLRIQDWKSFLRFRIDSQGNLEIYAIGIERVCRAWKAPEGQNDSTLEPDPRDTQHTQPHLIERVTLVPVSSLSLDSTSVCRVKTKSTRHSQ